MRFFADCMLGRLARWLRALGIDTRYEHAIEDDELLRRCADENRILLTRDTDLSRRHTDVRVVLIESESPQGQLTQVMQLFGIEIVPDRLFSRCTHCNSPIEEIDRQQVKGRVPPFVLESGERFTYCPNCDKIYWGGTHKDHFLDLIGNEEEK